jgi:hypothetical protein
LGKSGRILGAGTRKVTRCVRRKKGKREKGKNGKEQAIRIDFFSRFPFFFLPSH